MKKEFIIYSLLSLLIMGLFAFENKYSGDEKQSMMIEDGLNIESIESSFSATIFLVNHEIPGVKIEGNKRLLQNLKLIIKDGHLQIGQYDASYNPLNLLKLAMIGDQDLKIYINKPNAKDVYVRNPERFNEVNVFENEDAGMITLKKPKLFHMTQNKTTECLTLEAKVCEVNKQLL